MPHSCCQEPLVWLANKPQLSANLESLGEGQRLIAQAITKGCIKPRGCGHPCSIPPASIPFNFSNQDPSLQPASLPTAAAWWEVPRHGPRPVYQARGQVPQQGWDWGQGATRVTCNSTPVAFSLARLWIREWSKFSIKFFISVIEVREMRRFQVSMPWLTAPPGIHRPYEDQPASLQGWGHKRHHPHTKVGIGTEQHIIVLGAWITPFSPMLYVPCKVTQGSWWEVQGQTSTWMMYSPYWMSTITMSRPWILWIGSSFSYPWVIKRQYQTWGALSRHLQVLMALFLDHFPLDHVDELKCDHCYCGLPKWLKAMVAYLKASTNEMMYLD